jgi:nucleotide-binding universal stress UspA family protein
MAANSIVVATDGSRESVLAVEWAALEANRREAPLRIVSTSAMPPRMRPAYGSQETVADALRAASVQALATAASRAAEVAPNGDPDEAVSALQFAFDEAALRGASLRAVHAWYWLPELRPVWGAGEALTAGTSGTGLRRLDPEVVSAESGRQLAEMLAGWREKYPQVQLSEDVIHGHPGQVLASLSAHADLVVLGRHRRTATGPPGVGSIQHAVLNHARGPIAIIPSAP